MKVVELWGSRKRSRVQRRDVVFRKIQIKQALHSPKGPALDFVDFAELQMKRDHLAGAGEAVGREVVEVVTAEVEHLRLGGETSRDFGVTSILTGGVLGVNLERNQSIINNTSSWVL